MNWEKLLNHHNFGSDKEKPLDASRTPFNTDYDRIIFSNSFKRLDAKTQVHPLRDNDNIHSRLTHSLEVSTVGRSLGMNIGLFLQDKNLLPQDFRPEYVSQIVQTACLAHDIGNPPFGHGGEDIIRHWFAGSGKSLLSKMTKEQRNDFLFFDGNAQSLRILTKIEVYGEHGGIKPTYAMIASMMKYPWVDTAGKGKASCFYSEKDALNSIAEHTGLMSTGTDSYVRHPLAYLSEAADDICYTIVDLEDAHELNIIEYEKVYKYLWDISKPKVLNESRSRKGILAYLRAVAIGRCISAATDAFQNNMDDFINGAEKGSLVDLCEPETADALKQAKEFSKNNLYTNEHKALLETGAKRVIGTLLDEFCEVAEKVAESKKTFTTDRGLLKLMGDNAPADGDDLFTALHKVLDHVSGMTDRYAASTAKLMNGGI